MRDLSPTSTAQLDLRGKVAVVTGARSGLGFQMAKELAGAGAAIVITSRTGSHAETTARKLENMMSIQTLGLEMDVTDVASVSAAAAEVAAWQGHVDVLVNNAGGGSGVASGDMFERPLHDVRQVLDSNLLGTILCCTEFGRQMVRQRAGRIINIASIAALVGRDRSIYAKNEVHEQPIEYAAAKAGVLGLTRDLAAKLAPYGITVNAISPGGFDKGLLPTGFVADYASRTPLGRMGRPEEDIGGVCLFLASAAAGYMTGQNLVVDGGFSIWK